jgi:hypothetical protein
MGLLQLALFFFGQTELCDRQMVSFKTFPNELALNMNSGKINP